MAAAKMPLMFPLRLIFFCGLFTASAIAEPRDLSQSLGALRDKYHVPALAAAAMRDGQLVALGVSGVRQAGASDPVQVNDLWHIGSCTKSMTATLAGILVDEGKAKW